MNACVFAASGTARRLSPQANHLIEPKYLSFHGISSDIRDKSGPSAIPPREYPTNPLTPPPIHSGYGPWVAAEHPAARRLSEMDRAGRPAEPGCLPCGGVSCSNELWACACRYGSNFCGKKNRCGSANCTGLKGQCLCFLGLAVLHRPARQHGTESAVARATSPFVAYAERRDAQ